MGGLNPCFRRKDHKRIVSFYLADFNSSRLETKLWRTQIKTSCDKNQNSTADYSELSRACPEESILNVIFLVLSHLGDSPSGGSLHGIYESSFVRIGDQGSCQRDCRVSRLNLATFVINAETFDVPLVQVV